MVGFCGTTAPHKNFRKTHHGFGVKRTNLACDAISLLRFGSEIVIGEEIPLRGRHLGISLQGDGLFGFIGVDAELFGYLPPILKRLRSAFGRKGVLLVLHAKFGNWAERCRAGIGGFQREGLFKREGELRVLFEQHLKKPFVDGHRCGRAGDFHAAILAG